VLSYAFDWSVVTSGQYAGWLWEGLLLTLQLAALSCMLAFALGVVVALLRLSPIAPLRWLALGYLEFIRNTPLVIQIFFWYFGAYEVLPEAVNDWLNQWPFEFVAAVIALSIYTAAFIAEDIRSGIRAVPREQMEAARSQGFGYLAAMRHVILPQAVRITVPPLIGQFLNATKNSSLAMTIGVAELTYQARQIESYTFKGIEAFTAATLVYLALSLIITALVSGYDRRFLRPGGVR
jgi:polar amino acid transport system permease protein